MDLRTINRPNASSVPGSVTAAWVLMKACAPSDVTNQPMMTVNAATVLNSYSGNALNKSTACAYTKSNSVGGILVLMSSQLCLPGYILCIRPQFRDRSHIISLSYNGSNRHK